MATAKTSANWHDFMNTLGSKSIPQNTTQAIEVAEQLQRCWSAHRKPTARVPHSHLNLTRVAQSSGAIVNYISILLQDAESAAIVMALVDRLCQPTEILRDHPHFQEVTTTMKKAIENVQRHPAAIVADSAQSSTPLPPVSKQTTKRRQRSVTI